MLLSSQSPAVTPLTPPPLPKALMARTEISWRPGKDITASSTNRNFELKKNHNYLLNFIFCGPFIYNCLRTEFFFPFKIFILS